MSETSQAAPSFEKDIRPLFRDSDIAAMSSMIDLSSYDDVRAHAGEIHERLADGSMPCDGGWPDDQVATFKAWVDAGTPA
jgi:hypothetical protein